MTDRQPWTELSARLDEDGLEVTVTGRTGDSDVVLARRLDHSVGWGDLVDELAEFLARVFEGVHGLDLRASPGGWARLWDAAGRAICAVENGEAAVVQESALAEHDGLALDLELELSAEKFAQLVQPVLERVMERIDLALAEAGKGAADVSAVKLSGKGARGGLLARLLEEHFGVTPEVEEAAVPPAPASAPAPAPEPPTVPEPPTPHDSPGRAEEPEQRAHRLLPLLHPDDRADLSAALQSLATARAGNDDDPLSEALAELDDLLFFIEGEPL